MDFAVNDKTAMQVQKTDLDWMKTELAESNSRIMEMVKQACVRADMAFGEIPSDDKYIGERASAVSIMDYVEAIRRNINELQVQLNRF